MKSYVILLRGVMPSGKNRVPMAELRTALCDTGLHEVQTYIQSGNVVAKSRLDRDAVQSLVHETSLRKIGADISIIARTHTQVKRVLKQNPFAEESASRTYFTLLATKPSTSRLREFLQLDFAPDDVRVVGDTLYTLYATKHSDSRFNNNFFEKKLKVVATTRNYNTLSRLLELSA